MITYVKPNHFSRRHKDKQNLAADSAGITEHLLSISRHLAETAQRSADTLDTLAILSLFNIKMNRRLSNKFNICCVSSKLIFNPPWHTRRIQEYGWSYQPIRKTTFQVWTPRTNGQSVSVFCFCFLYGMRLIHNEEASILIAMKWFW
ncbi:hypothetical protein B566_EDAN014401 [Ephemera danica]|nr:hypothetical protein B566_EDAN014401 [Ephemera danica]